MFQNIAQIADISTKHLPLAKNHKNEREINTLLDNSRAAWLKDEKKRLPKMTLNEMMEHVRHHDYFMMYVLAKRADLDILAKKAGYHDYESFLEDKNDI